MTKPNNLPETPALSATKTPSWQSLLERDWQRFWRVLSPYVWALVIPGVILAIWVDGAHLAASSWQHVAATWLIVGGAIGGFACYLLSGAEPVKKEGIWAGVVLTGFLSIATLVALLSSRGHMSFVWSLAAITIGAGLVTWSVSPHDRAPQLIKTFVLPIAAILQLMLSIFFGRGTYSPVLEGVVMGLLMIVIVWATTNARLYNEERAREAAEEEWRNEVLALLKANANTSMTKDH